MTSRNRRSLPSMPLLGPIDFVRPRSPRPAPLDGEHVSFWYAARPAIFQAVRSFGIPGGGRVLMPAYACGAEYDALIKAGLSVDFYRIRPDMTPDLDHLDALSRDPVSILYVIHYFGFAQPMEPLMMFARRHGARVIEDCAPALYSADEEGRALGTIGDAGVFSFLKTLTVPDGGALVLNRTGQDTRSLTATRRSPGTRAVLGRVKNFVQEAGLHHAPRFTEAALRIVNPLIGLTKPRGAPRVGLGSIDERDPRYRDAVMEHIVLKPSRESWSISAPARFLFDRTPHDLVLARRRRNFAALADRMPAIPGVRPMFPTLPSGCCPLFYPLIADEPDGIHRFLRAHGIETKRIWSYFHDDMRDIPFPFENWLKMHVIALPVHHQLGDPDMAYMIDVIEKWCRTGWHEPSPVASGDHR